MDCTATQHRDSQWEGDVDDKLTLDRLNKTLKRKNNAVSGGHTTKSKATDALRRSRMVHCCRKLLVCPCFYPNIVPHVSVWLFLEKRLMMLGFKWDTNCGVLDKSYVRVSPLNPDLGSFSLWNLCRTPTTLRVIRSRLLHLYLGFSLETLWLQLVWCFLKITIQYDFCFPLNCP